MVIDLSRPVISALKDSRSGNPPTPLQEEITMKKWMLCAMVFSLLLCGCGGGPGKSPLVGKKTDSVQVYHLAKVNSKSFSKSWDDFAEVIGLGEEVVSGKIEDFYSDLAKQKVAVVYQVSQGRNVYWAVDVSPCKKKQKEEVEDIMKDFCKSSNGLKFYDTDHGFYYIGPDSSEFRKAVDKAEFKSWKKEECWGLIQNSINEPFSNTSIMGKNNEYMRIQFAFPPCFRTAIGLFDEKLKKYTVPLGTEGAVKMKAKSIVGISNSINPQKCVCVFRVTLDSKENAQKLQEQFKDYMSELAKVLDEKKVTAFLNKQKPKVSGNTVVWEFNSSWVKSNKDVMEDFKDAVETVMKESAGGSVEAAPAEDIPDDDDDDF